MTAPVDDVAAGYEALAPVYDRITETHDHAAWAAEVEELALAAGLAGRRLLDVGCGTGNLTAPMLERGYTATGVDVSPAMLTIAREKLGPGVPLHCADMRALPALGAFDLIWSLGDAVNYLLTADALVQALRGMARNLAPGGVLAFDAHTLSAFRASYCAFFAIPDDERIVLFDGQGRAPLAAGASAEAWIDRIERTGPHGWERVRIVHRQRHHPPALLQEALAAAGLARVAVWGTDGAGTLEQPLDEERHTKAVYIAHTGAPSGGRR